MTDISDDETLLESQGGDSSGAARPSLAPGERLGDYEIVKLIGAGAMGEVYLALQLRLGQRCAIKVLPDSFTKSADFEKRFESEGRSLAMLDHPGIVRVLNAGEFGGRHFLTMEYVGGGSLDRYLARSGALPASEARRILSEILAGLSYAHRHEVVHRDLKPANVLRTPEGHAKISDFGLALVAGEDFMRTMIETGETVLANDAGAKSDDDTLLESEVHGPTSAKRADAAAFVGTLDYMSPEIRYGRGPADARSDIYAVGVIAYQILTGRKPATGRAKAPSKIARRISTKWDEWVFKCMEEEPADRFQSADEALAALPGSGNGAKWKIPAIVGASVIVAGAIFAGWWLGAHSAKYAETPNSAVETPRAPEAAVPTSAALIEKAAPSPETASKETVAEAAKIAEIQPVVSKPETKAAETKPASAPAPVVEARGKLCVTTVPSGAEIRLNGLPAKISPCEFDDLPSGDYVVEISREGWPAELVSARIEPGKTATIAHAFKGGAIFFTSHARDLSWAIVSGPAGTEAKNYHGETPYTLTDLPPGEYVVEFIWRERPLMRKTVVVEAGKTATATVRLDKSQQAEP